MSFSPIGFFRFSGEPGTDFFSVKPSPDQVKDNDMSISPNGLAVFEFSNCKHTETNILLLYIRGLWKNFCIMKYYLTKCLGAPIDGWEGHSAPPSPLAAIKKK